MSLLCFSLGSSALNVSMPRESGEKAPPNGEWGGFTVDQFNNVIGTISVNVGNENMNWKARWGYIYISLSFQLIYH